MCVSVYMYGIFLTSSLFRLLVFFAIDMKKVVHLEQIEHATERVRERESSAAATDVSARLPDVPWCIYDIHPEYVDGSAPGTCVSAQGKRKLCKLSYNLISKVSGAMCVCIQFCWCGVNGKPAPANGD